MLDDGTVTRVAEQTFRLTAAEPQLRWLHMNAVGLEVQITDVTEQIAALSLQGPKSRAILNLACEQPVDGLKYFRMAFNRIAGKAVTVSRTGYTGDLGYEIWVDAARRARGLGRADGRRPRLRHHARRHPGDGHGAGRGRTVHARRRLHLRHHALDSRARGRRRTSSASAGR